MTKRKPRGHRDSAAKAPAIESLTPAPPPLAEPMVPLATVLQLVEGGRSALVRAGLMPRRKIAILGTTPSRGQAPFGDDTWEFWTIGPGGMEANRWDLLFELHGPGTWPKGFRRRVEELGQLYVPGMFPPGAIEHLTALNGMTGSTALTGSPAEHFDGYLAKLAAVEPIEREIAPHHKSTRAVVTMEKIPGWKANEVFPKDRIVQKYGRMWLSSSISWLIALAIEFQATDIGLWGIDLEAGEEYEAQFEGCRALIDLARIGLGITIHIPPGCGLLRDPNPYPDRWETAEALYVEQKIGQMQKHLQEHSHNNAALIGDINRVDGELGALRWAAGKFPDDTEIKEGVARLETEQAARRAKQVEIQAGLHSFDGQIGAMRHFYNLFVHKGTAKPHRA